MALATRPKPNLNHKKRQAGHHRHSKHYLKAYWPYIPMLMIAAFGLFISSVWSNRQHVLGDKSDFSSSSLLAFTNDYRAQYQVDALTIDPQLAAAAQAKAEDMAKNNYWSHTSPAGQTPWSFIAASGYNYQVAGENLAYGFTGAQQVVIGWMNSPEHRNNILDGTYQNVGFGVASSPNYQNEGPRVIVVAEYAKPAGASLAATPGVMPLNNSDPSTLVSRVEVVLGGQAAWSFYALLAITGIALIVFISRHGLRLKRLVFEGEAFISRHPVLDIAVVFIITAGIVLTRNGGNIR